MNADTPISALMTRQVLSLDMDATVEELRALFDREGLAWAPVTDGEGVVVGVVSATDLSGPRVAANDAGSLHAWQFCTYRPLAVLPDTPAREVARAMVDRGVHHVVVADESGLVGVVSSLDFMKAFARGAWE
jgi:CBS domain-containing protein